MVVKEAALKPTFGTHISSASTFESMMAPRSILNDIETLRAAAGGIKNTKEIFEEAYAGRDHESLRQPGDTSLDILGRVLREAVLKLEVRSD